MNIEPLPLFEKRETIQEAVEYADMLIESIPPEYRATAYTALGVVWNTIAHENNKEGGQE